jgi:hypothetical protein
MRGVLNIAESPHYLFIEKVLAEPPQGVARLSHSASVTGGEKVRVMGKLASRYAV